MAYVQLLDQHILEGLRCPQSTVLLRKINSLVTCGLLPITGKVTLATVTENLGITFLEKEIITLANSTLSPASDVVIAQLESHNVFECHLNCAPTRFSLKEFKTRAQEKLNERILYTKNSPLGVIHNACQDYLSKVTEQFIADYWASRVLGLKAFIDRFVQGTFKTVEAYVCYCLERDIPCARILFHFASRVNSRFKNKFATVRELVDEDAVWHLVLGRKEKDLLSPIKFVTREAKIAENAVLFAGLMIALVRHSVLPIADRLLAGGEVFLVNSEDNYLGHEIVYIGSNIRKELSTSNLSYSLSPEELKRKYLEF